jgi:hypothetical protein
MLVFVKNRVRCNRVSLQRGGGGRGEECTPCSRKWTPMAGNTVYKWEGWDYRWSRENLGRLSKWEKISMFLKNDLDFPRDQR